KWDLAINSYEKAVRAQPDNPDPYFHLAEAYQATGRYDLAIEPLKKSIAFNPDLGHNDYQVTSAHYQLGMSLLRTGHVEEGKKEVEIAADLKARGFKTDVADYAAVRNSVRSSAHSAEPAGGLASVGPVPLPAQGVIGETDKPGEKALAELKTVRDYCAEVVASAHENIGLIRAQQEDFPAAAGQFRLAAKWNPELERINFNWGLAAFKAGLYSEAIGPLEKELAASPANIPDQQLLGISYFMTGNFSRASYLLSVVIAARPKEISLYYPLAASLLKLGKQAEAERVVDQMILAGGNDPKVHLLLGRALQEQGEPAKAIEEMKAALALDGKTLMAHFYMGVIYLKSGKFDAAATEFESELALDPDNIEAKYHLAFVLIAAQKTERGIALMKEVVRLKPGYGEAYYELGKALLQQGDIKGAVENLELAVKLKPEEPYVHYQLGRAYLAAGRKDDGENQLATFKQLKDKVGKAPN
ncbi:MAG TPA: tetratricopeptide repeat protein, partial [Blastocatellia bacterium]|nr:tetratricopeptide repeat protein [Blastocatellia bacterium]